MSTDLTEKLQAFITESSATASEVKAALRHVLSRQPCDNLVDAGHYSNVKTYKCARLVHSDPRHVHLELDAVDHGCQHIEHGNFGGYGGLTRCATPLVDGVCPREDEHGGE